VASTPDHTLLKVRVAPGARKSEIAGEHGDAIRIKISAPALEGKANEALLEFVAEKLGVHRRDVALFSGHSSRDKVISIAGIDYSEVRQRLLGE
jgi:uncharacterized protein (TIGR00251 family)